MNKYLISPIAGVVAVIGFLCPWVSCGNMMTWSGLDLATGSGGGSSMMGDLGNTGTGGDAVGGDSLLWLAPIAAIGIVAIYVIFKNKNRLASALMPTIIVALLGIFVMSLTYIKVQNQKSEFAEGMNDLGKGGDSTSEESEASPSNGDFSNMMGGMGIQIEWGFWITAIAFAGAAYGATKYRDLPKTPEDITTPGTPIEATPPGEVVSSEPPPDASMTEDKGMG